MSDRKSMPAQKNQTAQETNIYTRNRFIPVTDWQKYHVWPSLGGLRHLVFHADKNGFNACIRRVGRRVLISEADFFKWMDSQVGKQSIENAQA